MSNLLTILATFTGRTVAEVEPEFAGRMYGDLKKEAAEAVVAFVEPFQARVAELLEDPAELDRQMAEGAARAREVAAATLADVYANLGFVTGSMSVAPVVPADVLGSEPQDWPLTIGVALPIPEPFLGELGAYRERFGDPLAHAIVAHITLVPPTEVADEEHLAEILAHLQVQAAAMEPFPVVLEGAGTFRPISQVVFVPIVEGEPEVRAAEAAVRRGPLGPAPELPVPPARDGRPRPRGGVARPGPRGAAGLPGGLRGRSAQPVHPGC